MSATHCDVHALPWKTVPAGVSRAGKAYNAFQACPSQGCNQRPPKPVQNGAGSPQESPQGQTKPVGRNLADVRLQARVEAWKLSLAYTQDVGMIYADLMAAYTGTLLGSPNLDADIPFGETRVG